MPHQSLNFYRFPSMTPFLPRLLLTVSLAAAFGLCPLRAEPGHVYPPLKPQEVSRITEAMPATARVKPSKDRKVLIFYRTEGFVHASIAHANVALKQLGEKTGSFTAVLSDD